MIAIPPKFECRAAVSPEEAAEIAGVDRATWYRHHYPHVETTFWPQYVSLIFPPVLRYLRLMFPLGSGLSDF